MEETGVALGSLLARDSISPLGEKLSPVLGREVLRIAAAVVKQHTGTPILFT
jgi:hypothetical protein